MMSLAPDECNHHRWALHRRCHENAGFFMFGSEQLLKQSNVLMAPSMKGPPVMVAFIGMSLAVLFGVPIHTNAVRTALDGILVRGLGLEKESKFRFMMISAILTIITNLVALSMDNLGLVVSVNGAVCATLMMYILPALMYMKFAGVSALPMLTLILGVLIGITGVTTSIMVADGETSSLRW